MSIHFYLHIIFSTHQQKPYLIEEPTREAMFARLSDICNGLDSRCVIASGSDDHVHLLVEASPDLTTDDLVTAIKSRSAAWLQERGGLYADFDWQESCVVFSISREDVADVSNDLACQAFYHQKIDFKTEMGLILASQEISFTDEIWE